MKIKCMNFFMVVFILIGATFVLSGCESEQEKLAREQDERINPGTRKLSLDNVGDGLMN